MMSDTVSLPCTHCNETALGTVAEAKGFFSSSPGQEYRVAGSICASCGVFVCEQHRQPACKAAGVKAKDCPSCRTKKAWSKQLLSPLPDATTAAPDACSGCGKELAGKVASIEAVAELKGPNKVPSAYVCYSCGAAFCTKWKCIKAAQTPCPECGALSPFTGRLVNALAATGDFVAAYRLLEQETMWVDSERGRAKLQPLLNADAADLIARALPDGPGDPLNIARLVELGRTDLVTNEVLKALARRADSDPAAASAIGRIAAGTGSPIAWNRVFAALDASSADSRGVLVGYLTLAGNDDRVVPALIGMERDWGDVAFASLDANAPSGELTRLSGWSSLGKVFNPAGIGGGPSTTVARLAKAALEELARGGGSNAAAAREALQGPS